MKAKKLMAGILIPAVIASGSGASLYFYRRNKLANTYVDVIPVSDIATGDESSSTYMSATVVNNKRQDVKLTTSQRIAEVLVSDGQEVNIGDALVRLDTTLDAISLQELKISIDKKNLEIYNGLKRLDKLMKTAPAGQSSSENTVDDWLSDGDWFDDAWDDSGNLDDGWVDDWFDDGWLDDGYYDDGYYDDGYYDDGYIWDEEPESEEGSEEESSEEESSEEESSEEESSEEESSEEESSEEESSEEESSEEESSEEESSEEESSEEKSTEEPASESESETQENTSESTTESSSEVTTESEAASNSEESSGEVTTESEESSDEVTTESEASSGESTTESTKESSDVTKDSEEASAEPTTESTELSTSEERVTSPSGDDASTDTSENSGSDASGEESTAEPATEATKSSTEESQTQPSEAQTEPIETPTQPSTAEPMQPSTAEPTQPSTAEPTQPSTAEPAQPSETQTQPLPTETSSEEQKELYSNDGHKLIQGIVSSNAQAQKGDGTKQSPYEFYCSYKTQMLSYDLVEGYIKNKTYAKLHVYKENGDWAYDLDLTNLIAAQDGELLDHEHDWQLLAQNQSCAAEGKSIYICSECGAVKTEPLAQLEHQYEEISRTEATCVSAGTILRRCQLCGKTEAETIAATGVHSYAEVSRTEATCSSEGVVVNQCTVCGHVETVRTEKTAHNMQVISDTPASCASAGYRVLQCTVCGYTQTEQTSPKTEQHTFALISGGEPQYALNIYQCTVCGYSYTESNPNYVAPTQPEQTQPAETQPLESLSTEGLSAIDGGFELAMRENRVRLLAMTGISSDTTAKGASDDSSSSTSISIPQTSTEDFSGYTAEELAKEIQAQKESLRDEDLERRKLELEYTEKEEKLSSDSVIKSTVKGVVKDIQNVSDIDYSKAFMTVDGGEGLYINGTVGEDMLDFFKPGYEFECSAWINDESVSFAATVTEVSDYPSDSNSGYSDNQNVSYYPFAAYIDADSASGLSSGSYVDISLTRDGNSDALFIEKMYVRSEQNKYYVYVENKETGLLEKRYVTLGKTLWNYYYEIKSGLTIDDMIAVPYGKNVREGAKTRSSYTNDSMNAGEESQEGNGDE